MTQRSEGPPSPQSARPYLDLVLPSIPRLIGQLDRETHSRSRGSFDREHWSWKFRDFPLGMLQSAVYPLALLWRHAFADNPYHANPQVLDWIVGAVDATLKRQHANGAFDAFGPNERNPGPTLGVIHGPAEALRLIGDAVPAGLRGRFLEGLRRACEFAMRREEDHAFVSNHWALFAVTFLDAAELLEEERYARRAEEIVERVLSEQSAEGWYREYEGPDPGYESLGIFHLATYWERSGSTALSSSLERSVEFFAHFVHPDGSVGGVYGSRNTSLYFPAGFEILARSQPAAAGVARYMRERLGRGNVVTPGTSDFENLPSLAYTYLEAWRAAETSDTGEGRALPCESLSGLRHFSDSGLSVAGSPDYYGVFHRRKGGACRTFDKRTGKVAYEDGSYLVRAGGKLWSSQFLPSGPWDPLPAEDPLVCEARFFEVRQPLPTPLNFVVLRLLGLTLFRSLALGRWIRGMIVRRLIVDRRPGPLRLVREIEPRSDRIRFRDRLEKDTAVQIEWVALPRAFTPMHMGSARYFHSSELEATPSVPLDSVRRELTSAGVARCEFTLDFRGPGGPTIHSGDVAGTAAPRAEAVAPRD